MKNIYLYTSLYPYSLVSESFLEAELDCIKNDYRVTVVPVSRHPQKRVLPNNISLDPTICNSSLLYKATSFLFIFKKSIMHNIFKELRNDFCFKKVFESLKYLYAAGLVYRHIKKVAKNSTNNVFYSYWFTYAPIAFSCYKEENPTTMDTFISRGHAGDIYTPEVANVFYPLKEYSLANIDSLFVISSFGAEDIGQRYSTYASKIKVSRLGVKDNFSSKSHNTETINLVSCSLVHQRKRVDLAFHSILNYAKLHTDLNITWTHIGGGELFNQLRDEIDKSAKPSNLQISLLGNMNNSDILEYYKKHSFQCFIITSKSEGIPVAIMEAISSGIPVLSTDVGGVREIITRDRGACLSVDYVQENFNEALDYIVKNHKKLSDNAYNFYQSEYNADKNYNDFYNKITTIK